MASSLESSSLEWKRYGLIYMMAKDTVLGDQMALLIVQPPYLKKLRVFPTKTVYDFEGAGIHLTVTFTTPSYFQAPGDWATYNDPIIITYITYTASSVDGQPHKVKSIMIIQLLKLFGMLTLRQKSNCLTY